MLCCLLKLFVNATVRHDGARETSAQKLDHDFIAVADLCAAEVCPAEIGAAEVSANEVGAAEVGVAEIGLQKVSAK